MALQRVPLLMLAEKDESDSREFYSLSERKISGRVNFPGGKGKKCMGVGFEWILTLSASPKTRTGKTDGQVNLVKPFDPSVNIQLPNIKTIPQYREHRTRPEYNFLRRAVLSADPSETSDFVLLVLVNGFLVFWRNGDDNWTTINQDKHFRTGALGYYRGKMYGLNTHGQLLVWDPNGSDLTRTDVILTLYGDKREFLKEATPYLVESTDGELLLIMRDHCSPPAYFGVGTTYFSTMSVDLEKRVCGHVWNFGGDAVFVGQSSPVAIAAAEFPGVLKPNCIYFTDDNFGCYFHRALFEESWDQGGGRDMGIYNPRDGSIERLDVKSYSMISPPLWI